MYHATTDHQISTFRFLCSDEPSNSLRCIIFNGRVYRENTLNKIPTTSFPVPLFIFHSEVKSTHSTESLLEMSFLNAHLVFFNHCYFFNFFMFLRALIGQPCSLSAYILVTFQHIAEGNQGR